MNLAPLRYAVGIVERWNNGILGLIHPRRIGLFFFYIIPVFHHSIIPLFHYSSFELATM